MRTLGIRVVRVPNGLVFEDPWAFVKKVADLAPHPALRATLSQGERVTRLIISRKRCRGRAR